MQPDAMYCCDIWIDQYCCDIWIDQPFLDCFPLQQADECNAEMKKQTEKFNENIQAAEDVKEGLEAGMDKLKQLAGGMNPLKDPILCFLICLAVTTFAGSVCIIAGVW